jgi:hypothetical protein
MVIKYTNIFHSKVVQNLPKIGIFGLKINHLATLMLMEASPITKFSSAVTYFQHCLTVAIRVTRGFFEKKSPEM